MFQLVCLLVRMSCHTSSVLAQITVTTHHMCVHTHTHTHTHTHKCQRNHVLSIISTHTFIDYIALTFIQYWWQVCPPRQTGLCSAGSALYQGCKCWLGFLHTLTYTLIPTVQAACVCVTEEACDHCQNWLHFLLHGKFVHTADILRNLTCLYRFKPITMPVSMMTRGKLGHFSSLLLMMQPRWLNKWANRMIATTCLVLSRLVHIAVILSCVGLVTAKLAGVLFESVQVVYNENENV